MPNRPRLSILKRCALCGDTFRPFTEEALTCSRRCSSIRRVKLHPEKHRMIEANQANARNRTARITRKVQGMTVEQAYTAGYTQGYATAHQRWMRKTRLSA